ncbi:MULTISPECIES: hypothetical protein [Nocardiopsidaceae]|uniref:Uncharacterized protein n=1 Tax=Streptomonospora nanhaiensis TaxID=1323731 RepID=A0ABY6YWR2_9ACTN|nr:hypothetical protein [Streptomonospora nanhaiensis]WAE76853.1 hypothetical protein OUQ99_31430 [Streptomonospora nanhaiensis]
MGEKTPKQLRAEIKKGTTKLRRGIQENSRNFRDGKPLRRRKSGSN